jgi:hypothetical protein
MYHFLFSATRAATKTATDAVDKTKDTAARAGTAIADGKNYSNISTKTNTRQKGKLFTVLYIGAKGATKAASNAVDKTKDTAARAGTAVADGKNYFSIAT